MITRIWHGKTLLEHADEYLNYIKQTGITDYQNTPGNLSAKILRRTEDTVCHFYVVTEWNNLESIKGFAGTNYEQARYYEQDKRYLLEFEEKVIHCETFTF